ALLPPREPEDVGRTYRWARAVLMIGVGWLVIVFFGYLKQVVGRYAPDLYLGQFGGPKAWPIETMVTSLDFVLVGLGSWAVLACVAPRAALLALPWIYSLSNGKW